jgi:hypothetical protein
VSSPITDTDPEAEHVQLELLRKASVEERVALALSLSRSVVALSRDGIRQRFPGATEQEIGLRFVALHYGEELAEEMRAYLLARGR